MQTFRLFIATLLVYWGWAVGAMAANADSATVRTNALMLGVGCTDMLDTYLSPEKYRGVELRLMSHTRRERDSVRWVNQFVHEGRASYADNRSGNGGEVAAMYSFGYSLLHKWHATLLGRRLRLMAGGTASLCAGFVYNTRNGNNPANARLALNIGPAVAVDYALRGGRRPLTLHYEASAPLAGLMFSPNYGQSYYEIFNRGNYDHNCVPTTFVSAPSLRHQLAVDFRLAHVTWRVGYLGDISQAKVNGLKQHTYTHALMIGLVKTFRTIKQRQDL